MIFIHDIHAEAQWTSSFIQSHRKLSSWDFCEVSERQNIKKFLIHVNWTCFNTNRKNKLHMLLVWNLTFAIVTVSFLSRRERRFEYNDTFTYYLNMKTDQKYSCCFKKNLLIKTSGSSPFFNLVLWESFQEPTPTESFSNVTVSVLYVEEIKEQLFIQTEL